MNGAWVAIFASVVVATQSGDENESKRAPESSGGQAQAVLETEEHWYAVRMMDRKVGWMVSSVEREEERIETSTELQLELLRGGQGISIRLEGGFLETDEGEPISMRSRINIGAAPVVTEYEFEEDEIVVTTERGGQTNTRTAPLPQGEWLTPAAAQRRMEQNVEAGAETFTTRTLDPLVGLQIVETTYQREGETTIEVMGKTVPAIKWTMSNSMTPGMDTTAYTDDAGVPLRTESGFGGMRMVMLATEKELALSDLEPGEMMANTLVEPSRPIEDPRELRRGVYTLSIPEGELPDIPATSTQRIERMGPRRARVTIDLDAPRPAPAEDIDDESYLGSSSMVDPGDALIRAMAEEAVGDAGTPMEKAEALRRHVFEHIDEKSLGVGFASASEVCRAGEGDCTEHGVLLAALLRAEGIPSRVATGLIYVDQFVGERQVFGYHMWTQALLEVDGEQRWVDLDATLPHETPTDATHIALSVSALGEGGVINSLAAQAPLMGQLSIDVEQTAH